MGDPPGPPQPYEIRDRRAWSRGLGRNLLWGVGIAVIGSLALGAGAGKSGIGDASFDWAFAVAASCGIGMFWVLIGVFNAASEYEPDLVVEPPGVRLNGVRAGWPMIRQIVVLPAGPAGGSGRPTEEIGLRLRFGAPLPRELPYVIYDPNDPEALHVRHRLEAGPLDPVRFDAAVRAFAPPGVEVVTGDPARLERPEPSGGTEDWRQAPATVVDIRQHNYSGSSQPGQLRSYKPYPVVRFTLPDGRHIITEVERPGVGRPGEQVMVSYDAGDPTVAWVHGGKPKSTYRFSPMPGASS